MSLNFEMEKQESRLEMDRLSLEIRNDLREIFVLGGLFLVYLSLLWMELILMLWIGVKING